MPDKEDIQVKRAKLQVRMAELRRDRALAMGELLHTMETLPGEIRKTQRKITELQATNSVDQAKLNAESVEMK